VDEPEPRSAEAVRAELQMLLAAMPADLRQTLLMSPARQELLEHFEIVPRRSGGAAV